MNKICKFRSEGFSIGITKPVCTTEAGGSRRNNSHEYRDESEKGLKGNALSRVLSHIQERVLWHCIFSCKAGLRSGSVLQDRSEYYLLFVLLKYCFSSFSLRLNSL